MAKGSAAWLPSPDPPPRNCDDTKPSTVAEVGQIPETPPGIPAGLAWQYRGGSLPNFANGTAGIGGDVLSTSRLTI